MPCLPDDNSDSGDESEEEDGDTDPDKEVEDKGDGWKTGPVYAYIKKQFDLIRNQWDKKIGNIYQRVQNGKNVESI